MNTLVQTCARASLCCVATAVLVSASGTGAMAGSDRFVQSVRAEPTADGWTIELRFSTPLRYVRHSPRDTATIALIELEALGVDRGVEQQARGRESLRPFEAGTGPPVVEVAAERAPAGGLVVEIRFMRESRFEVSQGSDLRRLDVTLVSGARGADGIQAAALLEAARAALAASDPERAVQLCSKVLSLGAQALHPEAQEMLGLARERAGQRAHALAEYQLFLRRWPDHEWAPRVRQRLQTLAMAEAPIPEERRETPRTRPGPRFDFHGNLASYYSRAESFLGDGLGNHVLDDSWFSDLYLNGRARTSDYEIEASASGRARLDFTEDDLGSDSRLSSLLVEAEQQGDGWWGNAGRQRGGGGVTGRFDGGRLGYQLTDRLDLHILGGFPLKNYSSDDIDTERFEVGAVSEYLDVFSLFDAELYTNYQREDDLTYRAAVGGELRHLRPERSIVASFDYDAYFNSVNIATLLADVAVAERWNVNALVDYRKSPILTLGNATIGQASESLAELQDSFSTGQIKELAKDRTADSTSFTLGGRYELNDRFDVSGNWTASELSGTSGDDTVTETHGSGYEYTYYGQLTGHSLLMDRGITTFGLRIFDGARYDGYMLQLNGRYPVAFDLRLNPILRVEYVNADEDFVRWIPRIRLDYGWRQLIFDLDVAFDMARSVGSGTRADEYGYALLFGVRFDF